MPKFNAFVEPGKYQVRVVGVTKGISKQGNEVITLRLAVDGADRCFCDHLVFTKRSLWKIVDFFIAIGYGPTDELDLAIKMVAFVEHSTVLIGRTVSALVGVAGFNGRRQNRIEQWLPPDVTSSRSNRKRR